MILDDTDGYLLPFTIFSIGAVSVVWLLFLWYIISTVTDKAKRADKDWLYSGGTIEKGGVNPFPPSMPKPKMRPVGQYPASSNKQ